MKEFELEPGEHVVMAVRRHWLIFVMGLLPYAILAVIPFAIPGLLALSPVLAPHAAWFDYTSFYGRLGLGIWLFILWMGTWAAFTRYYLSEWVLTNERLVDIDQRAFFSREVASVLLPRVQDVTTEVRGVLFSVLGAGDIRVQSAGAKAEFHMYGIPRPEQMRDLILKYTPVQEYPRHVPSFKD